MEIHTVDDCFKLRLLRKIAPDKEKAKKSLELANQRIESAEYLSKISLKLHYPIIEDFETPRISNSWMRSRISRFSYKNSRYHKVYLIYNLFVSGKL